MTVIATPSDVLFDRHVVVESDGCWRWTGPLNGSYPQHAWREDRVKRRRPARVWAWERAHGPVPAGALVVAVCGNRLCVSPEHAEVRSVAAHRETPPDVAAARFWSKVDRSAGPDGCWWWLGFVDQGSGYGRAWWRGRLIGAHQAAHELGHGWRPEGGHQLYVCHHCDHPTCCNPAHLYAGTPSQNSADRDRRGRARPVRGARAPGAKLTVEQVRDIRRRHAAGGTSYPKLAAEFGLHPQNIGRVVRGEGYADVDEWPVTVEPDPLDGGFIASVSTMPGVMSQGDTEVEAVEHLGDAIAAVQAASGYIPPSASTPPPCQPQ